MVKERYKDDSLDISDAGEKVKALINEHLIDLGINPRIPPIELLSPDFLENLAKHNGSDPEAKASEMEHAYANTVPSTSMKTRRSIRV
jgi:type I restriction enzyme R subunit